VKRYYVDGVPLKDWTDIVTVARRYGYHGDASSMSITADATTFLTEPGHIVEEKETVEPKRKIDETWAYCEQHPTTTYDYTHYDHCIQCERRLKRRKRFFALSRELGHGAQKAKDRAKAHFTLESFNDATIEQLDWLIDRLEQQKAKRSSEHQSNES
jgi:hypothetical protein